MASICINCGSADIQFGLADQATCLNCGQLQDSQGNALNPGMDEATRAAALARLAPRQQNVVGNLADLQRLGAEKSVDPNEPNFVLPAGVDPDKVPEHTVDPPPAAAPEAPPEEKVDTAKASEAAASLDAAAAQTEASQAASATSSADQSATADSATAPPVSGST